MDEKTRLNAVLVFPLLGDSVLLGMKTRKIGAGCWNGFGGRIEEHETKEEAAVRELYEESGLRAMAESLVLRGVIDSHTTKKDGSVFSCRVYVFVTRKWSGSVRESEEMKSPTWFPREALPFSGMMLADREWMQLMLEGTGVRVEVWYGPDQKTLLRPTRVQVVDDDL